MGGELTVGDYVTLQRGITYKGRLVGKPGPALLGLGSIVPGGGFREGDYKTYGGDCPPKIMLCPGDLFASLKGATKDGKMIGSVARVPESVFSGRLTQDTVKLEFIKANNETTDYLYWILRTPQYRDYCDRHATGSAVVALSRDDFLNYPVPPIDKTRKKIVSLLEFIEYKIELNRQMNATLESMAQALFKSWFVDFDPVIDNALAAGNPIPEPLHSKTENRKALGDKCKPLPEAIQKQFPSRFVFSEEMGWIPEGWEIFAVENVLDRLKIRKRYKKKDVEGFGSVPVFEQGADILLGYHGNEAEVSASASEPAFIFGDHTCVTKLSVEPFSISENVIALKGKGFSTYWVYYAVYGKQKFEEYRRHWMELIVRPIVTPPGGLDKTYGELITSNIQKQATLSRLSTELSRLRDTLLPKLLSGQIRIADAEKLLADVI